MLRSSLNSRIEALEAKNPPPCTCGVFTYRTPEEAFPEVKPCPVHKQEERFIGYIVHTPKERSAAVPNPT